MDAPRKVQGPLPARPIQKDWAMWFAGIDWADRHHDTFVIDEAGRKVAQLRVDHTPAGLKKLVGFLREIAPLDQIACILETNHGLLITALLEAGLALYPVNPKTIDRKRAASGAKTDLIDAYLLAKHGRAEWADLRRLDPDSPKIAELKALTRDQESLIQSQTRLVNQLTACLKAYYPAALQLFTSSNSTRRWSFCRRIPPHKQRSLPRSPRSKRRCARDSTPIPRPLLQRSMRCSISLICGLTKSRRAPRPA